MQVGAGQLKPLLAALICALVWGPSSARAEPRLELLSSYVWESRERWFGGLSGIEVLPGGTDAVLITDRGSLLHAVLRREDGRLVSADILSRLRFRNVTTSYLRGRNRDAEGLAIDRQGRAFMSLEHRHRIVTLDLQSAATRRLPDQPDSTGFPPNSGFEALAVHPDGRLFALPEGSHDTSGTLPVFAYQNDGWRITHRLQHLPPFVPVGADFDDKGHLYLLERAAGPLGFRSRIRRFDLDATPLRGEVLLTTFPATFDNLEGLSVWQDPEGHTRLTLISDDNFLPIQRTQLVEFILTD